MHIRSDKKNARNVYLSDAIGTDKEGDEVTYEEIIESNECPIEKVLEGKIELSYLSEKAMQVLKEREREIIVMRYGIGNDGIYRTQNQVADKMGISRSYVSRIEKKALEKLNEAMKKGGYHD